MPVPRPNCLVCDGGATSVDERASRSLSLPADFRVRRCDGCGFRWLDPTPTDAEYADIYEASYFTGAETQPRGLAVRFPPVGDDYEADTIPTRRATFTKRVRRIARMRGGTGTVLDVGAATGEFLAETRDAGFDVVGLEPSAHARDRARERFGLLLEAGDLARFDDRGRTFDVVHMSHVFEHVTDPVGVLDRVRSLLKPGGLFVIEIPNQFCSPVTRLVRWVKGPVPRSANSIHHPHFFGRRHIVRLLERHGFRILACRTSFPEQWTKTVLHRAVGLYEWGLDRIGLEGKNIEVYATPR